MIILIHSYPTGLDYFLTMNKRDITSCVLWPVHRGHGLPRERGAAGGVGGAASSLSPVPDNCSVLQLGAYQREKCSLREDTETARWSLSWTHKTFTQVSLYDKDATAGTQAVCVYVCVPPLSFWPKSALTRESSSFCYPPLSVLLPFSSLQGHEEK